jgi:hypothetical protein
MNRITRNFQIQRLKLNETRKSLKKLKSMKTTKPTVSSPRFTVGAATAQTY